MKKIAFFDIDGTITSELDQSIPESTVLSIRAARAAGNLAFINTGRTFYNVEKRFREIGFDGFVCGCGTNIISHGEELFHINQSHETTMEILETARKLNVDIIFESRDEVVGDFTRPMKHPEPIREIERFKQRGYDMSHCVDSSDFICDKFCMWYQTSEQLAAFRKVSDAHFTFIDRGDNFGEFVPAGFSKATGIQFLLDYYGIKIINAYAFGDSLNDLSMLSFVPNSIVMGNSRPESLKEHASYVTDTASADGIKKALERYNFF